MKPFLLGVWKLWELAFPKHRILQHNYLFNNYNVVIPRSIWLNIISMLKTTNLAQFEPIPTLHSEVTPEPSSKYLISHFLINNNYILNFELKLV